METHKKMKTRNQINKQMPTENVKEHRKHFDFKIFRQSRPSTGFLFNYASFKKRSKKCKMEQKSKYWKDRRKWNLPEIIGESVL